jgi:membrane protein
VVVMKRALSGFWSFLAEVYRRFEGHGCPTMSAAIAFYTLLSLIPLALLAISIFGRIVGAEAVEGRVIAVLREAGPGSNDALVGAIRKISERQGRWFVEAVGLLGLLWSGMNLVQGLSLFLTRAITGGSGQRTYLRQKLTALGAIAVAGMLFLLSIVFTSVISSLSKTSRLAEYVHDVNLPLSWLVFLAVSVLMFFLLYRFLPATSISTRAALVGAVPGAALWHVTRKLFSILVANSTRYGQVYGPLAGVVIFMVWIFYTAMILLFCAEVAAVWEERAKGPSRRGADAAAR